MSNTTPPDITQAEASGTVVTTDAFVTVKLMHDGQTMTFPVLSSVAAHDPLLLDYLVSNGMSGAANGLVKRHKDGTVEVIKRAGANGKEETGQAVDGQGDTPAPGEPSARPLGVVGLIQDGLVAAAPHFNPAVALAWVLSQAEHRGGLDLMKLMLVQGPIEDAIEMGEAEAKQGTAIIDRLLDARPVPLKTGSVLI